jgi:two-component system OmpR family sensor kinase
VTLVALLLILVAVALATTGGVATSLLRTYLTEQEDDQLHGFAQEFAPSEPAAVDNCSAARLTFGGGYVACIPASGVPRIFKGQRTPVASLPGASAIRPATIGRYGGNPFTVSAADGSTSWRLVAVQFANGLDVVVGVDLADDHALLSRLVTIEVIVGLLVLAILGVAGYLLVRNSLRPLAAVEHTAQAIAAGDLSRRVPAGDERTEVGRLSAALNGMLSRIESAFRAQQASEAQARGSEDRMRRFVADASHELRTPLTSIRGFAELYRQGAAGNPEEIRRLMERIEAEGARMGLLVEDLLLLARLDQQRPLSIGPVDLASIAGDAVQAARATAPDRPIALHLDESLTEAPVVAGDDARLRQVVGNLVTNALIHTPEGTRISVSLAQEASVPDLLTLTVADEGPGLDAADAARAFERFYRADSSRTRAAGGTGLGLAIVASLVAAHGGTVQLTTAPGAGAVLTVRLPRWVPAGATSGPH